jgi:protein-disulfide isomerase
MSIKQPKIFVLIPLLLFAIGLVTACGPSAPTAVTGAIRTPEPPKTANAVAQAAPAVDEARVEVNAQGIEVGFTQDGRPYLGNPEAPMLIEEFSDFQCPFCARFSAQTLPSLIANQIAGGEAALIFYDFPLESIHPQAVAAANASRCAGEQSAAAYWEMHDLLFEDIRSWSVADPNRVFAELGARIGLDAAQFSDCLASGRYVEAVRADLALGQARGVRSTPSFFLNGQLLVGAQPLQTFNSAIAAIQQGESIAEPQQVAEQPSPSPLTPPRTAPEPVTIPRETAAFASGDPNAPVTIVEFTDYQCPFCQRYAQETLPRILSEMVETGTVYYLIKDLPLDSLHPLARAAATAARCAGAQEAYLAMHDALFESLDAWNGAGVDEANAIFNGLAAELELDTAAFAACLSDGRFDAAIQQNLEEALALNAQATPYFFINGYPISGAQPYELFVYAVELAQAGTLAEAYAPPPPDLSASFSLGDPNAPVQIIEYTDFQCPFCARHFSQTFGQIKANYIDKGLVHYVFKDFPLTNIHPQAVKAAEAARCAGAQGDYTGMHRLLFEKQGEWSGRANAPDLFAAYAAELQLDQAAFGDCLAGGAYEAAVLADLEEGLQRGINGTPAFIINGYTMAGAQPYAIFEQAIQQLLNE